MLGAFGIVLAAIFEISHPFMSEGVQMLVDGFDETVVREMLEKDIRLSNGRHSWGAKVFSAMGDGGGAVDDFVLRHDGHHGDAAHGGQVGHAA